MRKFILNRPKAVFFKHDGVEHSEKIASIVAGPLTGDPDDVELAARLSLVRSAAHEDGTEITLAELDGLDVSGGLRDAYQQALSRARAVLPAIAPEIAQ